MTLTPFIVIRKKDFFLLIMPLSKKDAPWHWGTMKNIFIVPVTKTPTFITAILRPLVQGVKILTREI